MWPLWGRVEMELIAPFFTDKEAAASFICPFCLIGRYSGLFWPFGPGGEMALRAIF